MSVNNVNNQAAVQNSGAAEASRTPSSELGKDDFLTLLIAQLANQDPLKPMEDREFIAQMAQFSTLEQMTNMTKSFEKLASEQKYSSVSYVGKLVSFTCSVDAEGNPEVVAGKVLAVWFDPMEGTILETDKGSVALKDIHGVTG